MSGAIGAMSGRTKKIGTASGSMNISGEQGANQYTQMDVYGPNTPGTPAAPAAAAATPALVPADQAMPGRDVAYTGGDANALQYGNTMNRRRQAASQRLQPLLG